MLQVYLPMEIFTREFHGKLLLAIKLASMGHTVEIGDNHIIKSRAISTSSPAVYFEIKGQSHKGMEYLEILRKQNKKIIAQDEEAGISYLNFKDFAEIRPETNGIQVYDKYFCWGLDDYDFLKNKRELSNLYTVGSPRATLWTHSAREIFLPEIERIREDCGEFTLIISNLAGIANLMNKKQMRNMTDSRGYDSKFWNAYKKRLHWEDLALGTTTDIVNHLAKFKKIIFRPHPSESKQVWEQEFRNNPNVSVVKTGHTSEWIHASHEVIHSGSTAAIEAFLIGIPTYTFQDLIGYEDYPMTANKIGGSVLRNGNEFFLRQPNLFEINQNQQLISRKIYKPGLIEPLEQMAEAISAFSNLNFTQGELINFQPEFGDRNKLRKMTKVIRYGRSSAELLQLEKRPEITLLEFKSAVDRMCKYLKIENNLNINQVGLSSFRLIR